MNMNPGMYLQNMKPTDQAYAGEAIVNLLDLHNMKELSTKIFNEALKRPISDVQKQTAFRDMIPTQAPYAYQYAATNPPQALPWRTSQPDYTAQIQQVPQMGMTAPINTQQTYFNPQNIDTLNDIITLIDSNKKSDTPITCGLNNPFEIAYKVSPVVYLVSSYNGPAIHFNLAANKRISSDRVTALYTALSALESYFSTMFTMCKSDLAPIELNDSDVVVTIQNVKMSLGTLALIKYRMEKAYWDAASVNVSGYIITVNGGVLTIQKEGYNPVMVDLNVFRNIVNQLPALNVLTLNDDIFRMYQDDPKELTTRLIIELNKNMAKYELITYEDICVLDSAIGTQIKNSLLGKQIKLSENIE